MEKSMEHRLHALELQNRIFIGVIAALVMILLFIAAFDSNGSAVITCQQIDIVDADGKEIAMLGIDEDGSRGLFIYDQSGKLRLATIHDTTQTALYLLDATETIRVGAAQYAHGGGGFALHGEQSKGSTVLYHKDSGSLTFYGEDGTVLEKVIYQKEIESKE
ncbi:MAG: hypothetical protein DWP97_10500 [Calditrichaeota bacterium]|nr:MAG: hypothetical protein DWP97_10500 [Calditrichota bacterium]